MIDLAMPRDIEPAVRKLDGVYLYDLDSLQSLAERTLAVRKQESEKCHQLIVLHVQDFQLWIERSQSSNFPSMVVGLPGVIEITSESYLRSKSDAMSIMADQASPLQKQRNKSAQWSITRSITD